LHLESFRVHNRIGVVWGRSRSGAVARTSTQVGPSSLLEWCKAMEVKLIVTQGKQAGQEVPVAGRKFFIGRAEDCHLRPHSDLISRHHCVILIEDAFVAVRDFGTKNGTYVNGQKIAAEVELKSGDRLKVGQLEFEVRIDVGVGGKKLPKVHSVQEAAIRTAEPPRPQKPVRDDVDVSDWLSDEDSSPLNDTASLDPTQTVGISGVTSKAPAAEKSALPPAGEEPIEEEEPQGEPPKKSDPSTSRDAAARSLKHILRHF